VSTRERFPVLPDVPAINESGLKGYDASSWQGLSMPAGVPREIANRISAEVAKALRAPGMQARMLELGGGVVANTPEEFSSYVVAESDKWFRVAKLANVATE